MPTADQYGEFNSIKMLLIGGSGSGKTGALASLVNLGYEFFILDFDNGLEPLITHTETAKRKLIHYHTLTDELKPKKKAGKRSLAKTKDKPEAINDALSLVDDWRDDLEDDNAKSLGSVWDWGPNKILVIDSLTLMGEAAMRYNLALNVRERPEIQDWEAAINMQREMLQMLFQTQIKCHVICTSHIKFQESPDGDSFGGFPSVLGEKFPPQAGQYFNHMLLVKTVGSGQSAKRTIHTVPQHGIEVKTPAPKAPHRLSIEDGMAEYFKLVRDVNSDLATAKE